MRLHLTGIVLAAAALGLSPASAAEQTAARTLGQVKLEVSKKEPFGAYVTDAKGMSLYLFESDSKNKSTCYDACAAAWPPVLAKDKPAVAERLDESKLSTLKRKDGSTQVVYGEWPLYYYVKDRKPGDTTGQDIKDFGAEWYLVSPQGKKVEAEGKKGAGKQS